MDGLCQLYRAGSSITENYSIVIHDPVGSCLLNYIESATLMEYCLCSVLIRRALSASDTPD